MGLIFLPSVNKNLYTISNNFLGDPHFSNVEIHFKGNFLLFSVLSCLCQHSNTCGFYNCAHWGSIGKYQKDSKITESYWILHSWSLNSHHPTYGEKKSHEQQKKIQIIGKLDIVQQLLFFKEKGKKWTSIQKEKHTKLLWASVQFSSVAQSCSTLCNPMDCSTPGLPVHH